MTAFCLLGRTLVCAVPLFANVLCCCLSNESIVSGQLCCSEWDSRPSWLHNRPVGKGFKFDHNANFCRWFLIYVSQTISFSHILRSCALWLMHNHPSLLNNLHLACGRCGCPYCQHYSKFECLEPSSIEKHQSTPWRYWQLCHFQIIIVQMPVLWLIGNVKKAKSKWKSSKIYCPASFLINNTHCHEDMETNACRHHHDLESS